MGSVAVLTMADDPTSPGCARRQPLHPFFNPNRLAAPTADKPPATVAPESNEQPVLPSDIAADGELEDDAEKSGGRRNKRRKVDTDSEADDEHKKPQAKKRSRLSGAGGIATLFGKLASGSQCTTNEAGSTDPSAPTDLQREAQAGQDVTRQDNPEINQKGGGLEDELDQKPPLDGDVSSVAAAQQAQPLVVNANSLARTTLPSNAQKPKKLLLFNPKTGTIGSPPKPKPTDLAIKPIEGGKKRGPKSGKKSATRVVIISYGVDLESRILIGDKINAIISSQPLTMPEEITKLPESSGIEKPASPTAKPIKPNPSKSTHPFFLGKAKNSDAVVPEEKAKPTTSAREKKFSSTPCSPRKSRVETQSSGRQPQFGTKNAVLKFPGSRQPAWPWKGAAHVRGADSQIDDGHNLSPVLAARKCKGREVKIPTSESIMKCLTQALDVPAMAEAVRSVNTDDFLPAPPELRVPQKCFEGGSKLQARILPMLETFHGTRAAKNTAQRKGPIEGKEGKIQIPPELARLFKSISTSLSAFDKYQCETANWVQKYAPISAVEVLQHGREAFLLRDWLQALMVQSVDTGAAETEKSKAATSKGKMAGAGKKKRRKKLDGFIVSSEDEDYELNELSEEEGDWASSEGRGAALKTVVRPGSLAKMKEADKIANALVISGPHGCGKTAAVYAVAQELGFGVFEINSSSRRSGKDIMERIGDMTRNHQVRQHQSTAQVDDEGAVVTDDEVAKDLKSGKQPTMVAFFKPKAVAAKPKQPANSEQPAKDQPLAQQKEAKKDAPKNQRQSLILLEEVDILYEEDKQFWTTVIGLIVQSKRPFIMTCNDEKLVPLQTLRLHGIFRLSPPPREFAIDRLLLIAANEGHALDRHAIEALYESRNQDLRAATMDLQYWCQIGVGDRRGGQDWFFPRWPKGVDIDENHEVVRVVSQGTYQPGMNLLGRDSIVDPKVPSRVVEEELLHQTWDSWELDIGHWQDSAALKSWTETFSPVTAAPAGRLGTLSAFEDLAESMSMADIYSCKTFAMFRKEPLDATLPDLPAKTQEDFILGIVHLDTPLIARYNAMAASLASTTKSLARSTLQNRIEALQHQPAPELGPLTESQTINYIQDSFTSTLPGTPAIARIDFAYAFDPIAVADPTAVQPITYLEPSIFDRNFTLLILDVAPYVRGIVAHDSHLQKQRLKMSSLVSEGGRSGGKGAAQAGSKRMRTTRAALSALEGGSRSTTRGERWFKADINPYLVAKTAGQGWVHLEFPEEVTAPSSPPRTSQVSSRETSPDRPPPPKKKGVRGRKRKQVMVEDESNDELVKPAPANGASADI
ncbi:hypothetical protein B0H63DRAFT_419031 [Podospora didyma]|uniref:AAA+ ATPase domain-containing protein n=1 Tax=Podospora didyma TaxID=330526 RepID=A0AAE0N8L3_9PEZI|nr:hypothetical protein B0H63DRAFT_419031 [Podospora didyma]